MSEVAGRLRETPAPDRDAAGRARRPELEPAGRVEQAGSPADVYNEPTTAFVAGFVGAANVLHGQVVDGHVHLGTFQVPGAGHLEEGVAAAAYVRPHDVRVSAEATGVRGTIGRKATLGWLARLSVRLPGGETLVAHVPHDELGDAGEGDEIWIDLRSPKAFGLEVDSGASAPVDPVDGQKVITPVSLS